MLVVRKLANFELIAEVASDNLPDGIPGLVGDFVVGPYPLDEKDFFCRTVGFVHLLRCSVSFEEKYPFSISLGEAVTSPSLI